MLIPIQTAGTKPPLFFMHGANGLMVLGSSLARALGPDRPIYAIHANGIDGREPVLDDMRQMVPAYAQEIQAVRPEGPLVIGGMCTGCLAAIEIARRMRQEGRTLGPSILVDPPPIPMGYDRRISTLDMANPKIADQLYQQASSTLVEHASHPGSDVPFDPNDPEQVHAATLAGVGVLIALMRHIPNPFPGPAQLIVSGERAATFFHPQMPWQKLLPGPRIVYVIPWDHREMFKAGREQVCRLVNFMLDEGPALEGLTARSSPDAPPGSDQLEQPLAL